MKLVVGLGNPGKQYEYTRHNIGFIVLDKLLKDSKWSSKFNGLYVEKVLNGEKILFLKPQSFMNLSGGVVRKFVDYFDINSEDILIIQDDLDLEIAGWEFNRNIVEELDGITVDVPNQNTIIVKGIDNEKVGAFAAEIRTKRLPEPYKGKGIKYSYETIRRKEGKTGAKK